MDDTGQAVALKAMNVIVFCYRSTLVTTTQTTTVSQEAVAVSPMQNLNFQSHYHSTRTGDQFVITDYSVRSIYLFLITCRNVLRRFFCMGYLH